MNNQNHSILVADDDNDVVSALKLALKSEHYQVSCANCPQQVLALLERKQFSCILLDLNYRQDTTSGNEGMELIKAIRQLDADVPVIAMTGYASVDLAVNMMKFGANDFIEKPWRNSQLFARIQQQIQHLSIVQQSHKLAEENALLKGDKQPTVIAQSPNMQSLLQQIQRIAASEMNVLFTGENGTGKSMLAQYLHQHSRRNKHSIISVNMGAISESLFESEIFGHIKGAFTDAKESRIGRFELASQGSLFLDEIANIPPTQQAKLLHVLEDKKFERVGSSVTLDADVRLISATNAKLDDMVASGKFRQDLLYRLNTIEINIPPLRERIEDIMPLAHAFQNKLCQKYQLPVLPFSSDAVEVLLSYAWPGNIRELSHCIERALFLATGNCILVQDLNLTHPTMTNSSNEPTLQQIEKSIILERLNSYQHDPLKTAQSLGLSRSAYYRRLEKHQLNQL